MKTFINTFLASCYSSLVKWWNMMTFFLFNEWVCAIVAGVCLFSEKDRKTHIRYVCGVRCWWAGPVLEVWLVRALFIACKLCWDYNLRAFCTVLKLYSVCLLRMQTGRFPEDKSQSWRFGQLCPDTGCALDSLADLSIFLRWCWCAVNQSILFHL